MATKPTRAALVERREDLAGNTLATPGIVAPDPQQFNLDDFVGFTFRGKPILDQAGVISHIDSGNKLAVPNGTITYTFLDKSHLVGLYNNPGAGFTSGLGLGSFSAAQRAEARQSIQFWDDIIAPRFVEKNGVGADIVFANSADPAQAYAFYPGTKGWKFQSDVFIADPALNSSNNWLNFNGYGATTLIHEIGHTIGLSHPGAYNFDPNVPQTYLGLAEYAQDSTQYSIMSYWSAAQTGASIIAWNTFTFGNAQTPLIHDILTAQAKYGADPTTRAGNTVYGFNSTAARDVFDFTHNAFPYLAIYDAGGNDTIDLSGFNASVFLNLHAGTFSSAAQAVPTVSEINIARAELGVTLGFDIGGVTAAQVAGVSASRMALAANNIARDTGVTGIAATAYDNIAIAYGTVIENGIGGSARDLLWGNEVANTLNGMGGDDVLNGFEGADTLIGGAGADTFQFDIIEKGDRITDFVSGTDKIDLRGTGVDFTYVGGSAFSGVAGQLRYAGGVLSGDVNGDGVADLMITVGVASLAATDLLII
jgi:serralysin